MILIDTSAWVEFLRATGSPADREVQESLRGEIATCDPIRMEVLAGARDDDELASLRSLLSRAIVLPVTPATYEDAARLYRRARSSGTPVRRLMDCLIAAVAITHDVQVLHADRDFTTLANCSRLRA
ncbi:MAG: PIN domain nuclease [Actinomycetales bacterium]|nr:PIN domain nuclease [Actinomycetales bacterium]